MTNFIDTVVDKLETYPSIKFDRVNDHELKIFRQSDRGFDILLQTDQRENTLHLGGLHWHFENNEDELGEMLTQLAYALTGITRLKELSKNGKVYKWVLQIQDSDGVWRDDVTMSKIVFNFWAKKKTKYLENYHLPKDALNNPQAGS